MLHSVAIVCKSCKSKWKLDLPLTENHIESLATICSCGNIIVGNYKSKLLSIDTSFLKTNYLSNGGFDFLDFSIEEVEKLTKLPLE